MNPYLSGMPWASTATYPAGAYPWSSQPTCILPAYSYFTPSKAFAPSAPEFNAMFRQRDEAIVYNANALAILGTLPAQNWLGPVIVSAITTGPGTPVGITTNPVWDAHGQRWLCLSNHSVLTADELHVVRASVDGGRTWDDVGTAIFNTGAGHISNLAVKPDGTILFTYEHTGGGDFGGYSYTYDPTSDTWTSHSTAPNASSGFSSILAWFNAAGVFLAIVRNATTGHSLVATSPDGITWTDRTGAAGLGAFFPRAWASDGTKLLAFGLDMSTCYQTIDGVTWTPHAFASFVLGDVVTGAAYSATDGAYLVAARFGRILSSVDGGVTWTVASTFPGGSPQGLAALGNLWVTTVQGAPGGVAKTRVWYSTDVGATWAMSVGGGMASGVKTSTASGITSSGTQFMAWTCDQANGSLITGQAAI